jgi:hypothetical protein
MFKIGHPAENPRAGFEKISTLTRLEKSWSEQCSTSRRLKSRDWEDFY